MAKVFVLSCITVIASTFGVWFFNWHHPTISHKRMPSPTAEDTTTPWYLPAVELSLKEAMPRGVLLITVDTLRADYLSAYGNARIFTPGFDKLAASGVLFRRAIAAATTTTPSHASLMTSLYLQDHNIYSNFEALGNRAQTMAEIFHDHGYKTFALVNMRHLNPDISNLGQGFDHVVKSGFMRRAEPSIAQLIDWLDGLRENEQFFAWIHLADVHTPYRPPKPYDQLYYGEDEHAPYKKSLKNIWSSLPKHMSDHPFFQSWLSEITDLQWVLAQYQGAVSYVDEQFDRLLGELTTRNVIQQTAIVLTADHGESLGEHDMYFVHTGLYDVTAHVPLIMYLPGLSRPGIEVRDVVETVDVLPTLLETMHLPIPTNIRGKSLWPLIHGEVGDANTMALIEHAGRSLVALRSDRYKYIQHLRTLHIQPSYPFVVGKEELYDLERDPGETDNLVTEKPELAQTFRQELHNRRATKLNFEPGENQLNQETIAVLRTLGYVR